LARGAVSQEAADRLTTAPFPITDVLLIRREQEICYLKAMAAGIVAARSQPSPIMAKGAPCRYWLNELAYAWLPMKKSGSCGISEGGHHG
jgi:hypothetical protein